MPWWTRTYVIVFITRHLRTVLIAMWVNLKNIVLSGKNKNEMHKLVFPEVKKEAPRKTLCPFCEHSCKHRYTSSTLESLPVGWGAWKWPKGIKGNKSIQTRLLSRQCESCAKNCYIWWMRPCAPEMQNKRTKSSAFLFLLGFKRNLKELLP